MSPDFTPLLMTAFGDLFLRDHSDRIHFLDLMSGEFKQVADSQEDFERLCEDRERRRSWFLGLLLTGVRTLRGELAADECYSCKIPLSFGGQLEPDNFERSDLLVHYSILGQLYLQMRHLPPGTSLDSIKLEATRTITWLQKLVG